MAGSRAFNQDKRRSLLKSERERLSKIEDYFISEHDRIVVCGLLDDLAFLWVQMEEAKEDILRHGITETYKNGANQSGRKKSSAVEAYDRAVNSRLKIIRQLVDMLPHSMAQEPNSDAAALDSFINDGISG